MAKQVPFDKIKPGAFFRIPRLGRALYQRRRDYEDSSQIVSGKNVGRVYCTVTPVTPVTPVNAKIVEEK